MTFIKDIQNCSLLLALNITGLSCQFTVSEYSDNLYLKLKIICPPTIASAVHKRKAEYLVGRYLSKILLANKNLPSQVEIGNHRQPIWPMQWIGSITHTHNRAVSCLASKEDISLLGIDLENWLDENSANRIKAEVISKEELSVLTGNMPYRHAVTLAFSAKESFFKASYPLVKKYFDFHCVKFTNIHFSSGTFKFRVTVNLSEKIFSGQTFSGVFKFYEHGVFTAVFKR